MLVDGRKVETSSAQASGIEESFQDMQVDQLQQHPTCYHCGFDFPHKDQKCPACTVTCSKCGIKGHFSKVCCSSHKSDHKQLYKPRKSMQKPQSK